jgi:hypothetical protein
VSTVDRNGADWRGKGLPSRWVIAAVQILDVAAALMGLVATLHGQTWLYPWVLWYLSFLHETSKTRKRSICRPDRSPESKRGRDAT